MFLGGCAHPKTALTREDVQKWLVRDGEWVSGAPELRPQEDRTDGGKTQPFSVSRSFRHFEGDRFVGVIESSADPYGQAPFVKLAFKGHVEWQGDHPIAAGPQGEILGCELPPTPKCAAPREPRSSSICPGAYPALG